jgi:hypothetical protein
MEYMHNLLATSIYTSHHTKNRSEFSFITIPDHHLQALETGGEE